MKSGPALNGWTTRPRAVNAASNASVMVVLPTLLPVPAMMRRGAFIITPHKVNLTPPNTERPKADDFFVLLIAQILDPSEQLHGLIEIVGR